MRVLDPIHPAIRFAIGVLVSATVAEAVVIDRVAAIVGNEVITQGDVDHLAQREVVMNVKNPTPREMLLARLIDRKLILREAKRRGMRISDADVEAALDEIQARNHLPDRAALQQAVTQNGAFSWEDYLEDLKSQMALPRLVGGAIQDVNVTEDAVRAYYDAHPERFLEPEEVHLEQMLFRAPAPSDGPPQTEGTTAAARAQEAMRAAQAGEAFDALAKRLGAEWDHLGKFKAEDLAPEISRVVFALAAGEVSVPIETDLGWHLFQVTEKTPPQTQPFVDSARLIHDILIAEGHATAQDAWLKSLRETTHVQTP